MCCLKTSLFQLEPAEGKAADLPRKHLQNVMGKIFILAQLTESGLHIGRIDLNRLTAQVGGVKTDFIEQAFHHRRQTPGANIFGAFIHVKCNMRQALDALVKQLEVHIFRGQQGLVLSLLH